LRFLTPVNPSFGDNGEFVSVGQSIPAGPPKKKFQGNQGNNPGKRQNQGNNQGNDQGNNQGGSKNVSQGNNRKGNNQQVTNTDQNNTNQNQTKNPKNNPGKRQNQGNNQGGSNNPAKKTGKAKYQLKSHPDTTKNANILQPQEDILDNSPLTYYEVSVRNTSTNEIVLTLLRRQDELDRPIILRQEITF